MSPKIGYIPHPEQMALWPDVSGNTVNGLGEEMPRRPSPVYWHAPDSIPHGKLQQWFYSRPFAPEVEAARERRQKIMDKPIPPLAPEQVRLSAGEWTRRIKARALEVGADLVGITHLDPADFFETVDVPPYARVIVIGIAHDYENMKHAPESRAAMEVIDQYGRGQQVVRALTGYLHEQGWEAEPLGGPLAGPMIMIPAALRAGLGELGKHGSIINRTHGSSFRLACVLTNLPLLEDGPDSFGADDFCAACQVCAKACPPAAIGPEKQIVRGVEKWYVDFDRCLPYFNETQGCGICIAVCPWSRPGIADNLLAKMAKRQSRQ